MAKKKIEKEPYDKSHKIVNLYMVITIVNQGMGEAVMYLIEKHQVSGQFIQKGEGTASKQILDLLSVENNSKEVIYSFVKEAKLDEMMNDLDKFLKSSKRVQGIAFSIKLDTIAGRTAYHFLTQTVE
ncbi:MAG: hypothetical protein K6F59_02950 [Gammaproteobacteria bacterium]|nr:hypothetical protein [Gammaproteobacteria bacterium]